MWVKKLDAEELGVTFMPRSMDPLDNKYNKYDNMVEDEEEFEEVEIPVESHKPCLEFEDTVPEPSPLHEDKPVLTPTEEEACWEYFLSRGPVF